MPTSIFEDQQQRAAKSTISEGNRVFRPFNSAQTTVTPQKVNNGAILSHPCDDNLLICGANGRLFEQER
jgi:hypothetical protein